MKKTNEKIKRKWDNDVCKNGYKRTQKVSFQGLTNKKIHDFVFKDFILTWLYYKQRGFLNSNKEFKICQNSSVTLLRKCDNISTLKSIK